MTRKPANPKPWHCIACKTELPPERQQGRCLECLIGKRDVREVAAQYGIPLRPDAEGQREIDWLTRR